MNPEYADKLKRVYCDVIEKMAFMFGDVAQAGELPESPPPAILAHISFDGLIEGTLALAVPKAMGAELAANALGVDRDDPAASEKAEDSVKELLNVVCGNLLTEIAGEDPVFDLSIPEIVELSEAGWKKIENDRDSVAFIVDDYPNFIRLAVKE